MSLDSAITARALVAESFLREVVFRSRAQQTLETELLRGAKGADAGNCGLGAKAAVALDLSPQAEQHFTALWPNGVDAAALERVRDVMGEWARTQDALDRKRNHFLKAFRHEHGFDRRAYSAELLAQYEAGLAKIADEENAKRRDAAAELLGAGG